MAEPQPRTIHEGSNTGDVEDEVQSTAKTAEDRKAAAAMANLDSRGDDASNMNAFDQEAVSKAMKTLGGAGAVEKKEVKKVKVDATDVALLVGLRIRWCCLIYRRWILITVCDTRSTS